MKFKLYRCYQHSSGGMYMQIVGRINSRIFGKCFCGEVIVSGDIPRLKPVGTADENAENWSEVTKDEYTKVLATVMERIKLARDQERTDKNLTKKLQIIHDKKI